MQSIAGGTGIATNQLAGFPGAAVLAPADFVEGAKKSVMNLFWVAQRFTAAINRSYRESALSRCGETANTFLRLLA
jgi:hypothetical protein